MEISEVILVAATSLAMLFAIVYFMARKLNDASIIDIAWGVAQIVVAGSLLVTVTDYSFVRILVSLYAIIWGVRLALHIGTRKLTEKAEDKRYQKFRKDWGDTYWWRSILQIYVLQAVLALIIAAPVIVVAQVDNIQLAENAVFVAIGSAIWWYGFLFEALGDWQLKQFIKTKKKGQLLTTGLWKYTRHPNYFGEVTQWWGLWIIVLPLHFGVWAIVSPLLITILILKVSGITMLERRYEGNKAYDAYKKTTSAFIPLPPKK